MKITVIVTVYNERPTILKAIEEVKDLDIEKQIIVIDNCSTDGTREVLRALNDDSIEIVFQPKNYGYGQSVITGGNLARGKYIFVQNSDLEYDASCVYEMIELAEKEHLDVVFGSRLAGKRNESTWSLIQERPYYLATIISTFLINRWYKKDFTDVIGNKFYRTMVLKEISPISNKGMGFDFEVVSKLSKRGYRIKEIPVSYKPRSSRQGKKIKAIHSIPALFAMLKVRLYD